MQTVWEGKKIPAHKVARKKDRADQKSPIPPLRQELNGPPLKLECALSAMLERSLSRYDTNEDTAKQTVKMLHYCNRISSKGSTFLSSEIYQLHFDNRATNAREI